MSANRWFRASDIFHVVVIILVIVDVFVALSNFPDTFLAKIIGYENIETAVYSILAALSVFVILCEFCYRRGGEVSKEAKSDLPRL